MKADREELARLIQDVRSKDFGVIHGARPPLELDYKIAEAVIVYLKNKKS